MQEELKTLIEAAATQCDAQIRRRPYRQKAPALSSLDLNDHGPTVIAKKIQQVVAELSRSRSLPAARTFEYWKKFFSLYAEVKQVVLVRGNELSISKYPGASQFFEARERIYMRTRQGAELQFFGHLFDRPDLVRLGREDGWQVCGFQLFYEELLDSFSDPTPLQHEAVLMAARVLAYCVSMLKTVSVLDELRHIRPALDALNKGCVPVTYDQATATLYVKNWR